VRGKGDITLITSHPSALLDYHHVVHSHVAPADWLAVPPFSGRQHFASVRHAAGTVTSACFSLNALASEYIQRFVPSEQNDDLLRQRIALHKLSNLTFFEALLPPFKAYMEEFNAVAGRYTIMRWEDLISDPVATVRRIATARGVELSDAQAADIWRRLDHVNLTGAHKHNYRVGHGVVGGWKRWIVNRHLEMLDDYGLSRLLEPNGYGRLERLDEAQFTPFQRQLGDLIARGEVFNDTGDADLFGFAFNKSNIDISRFAFKRYPWREHTQIERSSCSNDALVDDVSDAAETVCGAINAACRGWLAFWAEAPSGVASGEVQSCIEDLVSCVPDVGRRGVAREAVRAAVAQASGVEGGALVRDAHLPRPVSREPMLLESIGTTNIVEFRERYYALPQALGPVDFHVGEVDRLPGVRVAGSLDEITRMIGRDV
jgi:hypothetical protein